MASMLRGYSLMSMRLQQQQQQQHASIHKQQATGWGPQVTTLMSLAVTTNVAAVKSTCTVSLHLQLQ
jgi:hypothetical protein